MHSVALNSMEAFAKLPDRPKVLACSAKQAKRLLKQPGATALFAMAKEQTEGHCKSVYVAGLSICRWVLRSRCRRADLCSLT